MIRTTRSPAVRDLVALGDDFFDGEVEVGEARAIGCDRRFLSFNPTVPATAEVRIIELVYDIDVPFVPGFFNVPLDEHRVRFD